MLALVNMAVAEENLFRAKSNQVVTLGRWCTWATAQPATRPKIP